jgi:hypothetical protein
MVSPSINYKGSMERKRSFGHPSLKCMSTFSLNGEDGIRREITTSYNPQKNGVEEIRNCSIMEAIKSMIHD